MKVEEERRGVSSPVLSARASPVAGSSARVTVCGAMGAPNAGCGMDSRQPAKSANSNSSRSLGFMIVGLRDDVVKVMFLSVRTVGGDGRCGKVGRNGYFCLLDVARSACGGYRWGDGAMFVVSDGAGWPMRQGNGKEAGCGFVDLHP